MDTWTRPIIYANGLLALTALRSVPVRLSILSVNSKITLNLHLKTLEDFTFLLLSNRITHTYKDVNNVKVCKTSKSQDKFDVMRESQRT